ncbi:MAG: YicC family protein [Bacteroidales bacterium]|nr:YicC family protein [Bacteroidales bacterium]
MIVKSMTGYGRIVKSFDDKKITVEIKSLNSKQTDITIKLPSNFNQMEVELKNLVNQVVKRGKVYCQIAIEYNDAMAKMRINKEILDNYLNNLENICLSRHFNTPPDILSIAMRLPEVVSTNDQEISQDEANQIKLATQEALTLFDKFRLDEGEILSNDFQHRILIISDLLKDIAPYEEERIQRVRERLRTEMANLNVNTDQNRFEQEIIYYLEKLDITEEKIRLKKHLEYFEETLSNEEEEKGKKLGFITQEIGREINTLGSKANHAEMQKLVVQMKDELEKIKEQLLNIL